jgi:hypothetical protein
MSSTSKTAGNPAGRPAWEPPALTVLSLRDGTRERMQSRAAVPLPCPPPPRPAEVKPGLYIELMVATARFDPVV